MSHAGFGPAGVIAAGAGDAHAPRTERHDGSGYPRGLRGEEIPLAARIFAVVDLWDALVAERAFRHSSSKEEAMAYLKDQAGKTLDPHVVEAFVAVIYG